ncbi:hypothetical protein AB0368_09430 [Actinoplanes sp. NPDC051475]|uniref:hypothetical protein n=1 Tax=Actinoplanes sp. NPDC051475 TaxID=3157225 RepID=UPI00344BBD26
MTPSNDDTMTASPEVCREKRWKRYEKPLPGNRLQIDVKFIEPIGLPTEARGKAPVTDQLPKQRRRAKYYQFTAIDDCTRLRVLRIYPRCDQKTAIQFLDYVLQRLPFRVEVIHGCGRDAPRWSPSRRPKWTNTRRGHPSRIRWGISARTAPRQVLSCRRIATMGQKLGIMAT